jgi:flagellar basal body-associated protein FliL
MKKLVWIIIAFLIVIVLGYKIFVFIVLKKDKNVYYDACIGLAESHFSQGKTNQEDFEREKTRCKILTEEVYGSD